MIPEESTEQKPAKRTPRRRVQPHSSLAAWRRGKNFTQREAGAYLGISQAYYYKLESKTQTPRKAILKTLVELTGVPLDELMGLTS